MSNFPDMLKGLADFHLGKVIRTEEYEPKRLTEDELAQLIERRAELVELNEYADDMGFAFNSEYSDTPDDEIWSIDQQIAEHLHEGKIVREIREPSYMEKIIIDQFFNSRPTFDYLRSGIPFPKES